MSIRILESVCTDMVQNPESISRNIKENGSLIFFNGSSCIFLLSRKSFAGDSNRFEESEGSRIVHGFFIFDGGADIKFPA